MMIECGPRLMRIGKEWKIQVSWSGMRVIARDDAVVGGLNDERFCDAAARWLGFDVDSVGYIRNWDEVPHLWSMADVD